MRTIRAGDSRPRRRRGARAGRGAFTWAGARRAGSCSTPRRGCWRSSTPSSDGACRSLRRQISPPGSHGACGTPPQCRRIAGFPRRCGLPSPPRPHSRWRSGSALTSGPSTAGPSRARRRLKPEATRTVRAFSGRRKPREREQRSTEAGGCAGGFRESAACRRELAERPVEAGNGAGAACLAPGCVASGFSRKTATRACESRGARLPSSDPPVIVEPSRALAIQRLRELMTQGRLDEKMLPPPVTPEAALAELTIAPLEIAEIRVPDVEIVSRPPAAPQRQ